MLTTGTWTDVTNWLFNCPTLISRNAAFTKVLLFQEATKGGQRMGCDLSIRKANRNQIKYILRAHLNFKLKCRPIPARLTAIISFHRPAFLFWHSSSEGITVVCVRKMKLRFESLMHFESTKYKLRVIKISPKKLSLSLIIVSWWGQWIWTAIVCVQRITTKILVRWITSTLCANQKETALVIKFGH